MRRRRRRLAAAAGAVLLVPAVAAANPAAVTSPPDLSALNDVGRGLVGLTDPDDVSADGTLGEDDEIGKDLLDDAGNPDALRQDAFDLPTGPLGIPGIMLQAYQRAAQTLARTTPGCHMDWPLLASIGRIESGHANGGRVFANGDTLTSILGPVLNGGGFAAISDTDDGALDGDSRWDRAVGAMQFIPSTWRGYASDGNGDRVSNPHNVFDATLAAGRYLCSGGLDMANPQQRAVAVFRYNHSDSYVRTVLIWADAYAKGVTPLPSTQVPPLPLGGPGPALPGVLPQPDPQPIPDPDPDTGGGGSSQPPSSTTTNPTSSTTTPTCPTSTTPPTSGTTTPTPPPPGCTTTTTTTTSESSSSNPDSGDTGSTSTQSQSSSAPSTTVTPTTQTQTEQSSTAAESSSPAQQESSSAVGP